ncbi:MAG: glycosyltransferase family 2 protein [Acidobacteria bacterium]|nr:glycosyltransferase family 2 protein [Acidobacteriota bacterium]
MKYFGLLWGSVDSYNFLDLPVFLAKLREGYQLVMGNRFLGGIEPGAMPPLHKYLGNPVLTFIGRLFFRSESRDFHCGLRAFDRRSIQALGLRTTGMEFASEMVVKASLHKLRIAEVPTTLKPDGRSRPPHLRSWRDGWRHLRFLLMYSPRWLFLLPGLALIALGLVVGGLILPGPVAIGGVTLDVHTLLFASLAVLLGAQAVFFAVFTKVFALTEGLLPPDPRIDRLFEIFNLERGLIAGVLLTLLGLVGAVAAVWIWSSADFGDLEPQTMLRLAIPSTTAIALGVETIFASFFLSILGLKRH